MKKIFFALLLLTASGSLFAQDKGVRAACTQREPSGYTRYEKNVYTRIDWLMTAAGNMAPDKLRQQHKPDGLITNNMD